jgi:hypothetical protein
VGNSGFKTQRTKGRILVPLLVTWLAVEELVFASVLSCLYSAWQGEVCWGRVGWSVGVFDLRLPQS